MKKWRIINIKVDKYLWIFMVLIISYVYLIFILLQHSILPSKFFFDSKTIYSLIYSSNLYEIRFFDSYKNTALLYSPLVKAFPLKKEHFDFLIGIISWIIVLLLIFYSKHVRNKIWIISFLTFPFFIFHSRICKDIIPAVLNILILFLNNISKFAAISFFMVSYFVYGLFFRQYYILTLALTIFIFIWESSSKKIRLLCIIALLTILNMIVDPQIFNIRNNLNAYRIGDPNSITIWFDPFPHENMLFVFLNYCYSILRTSFPVFWRLRPQEIFLTCYVLTAGYYLFKLIKIRYWPAYIFLAHWMILELFEPDLGSFLRHLSTGIPFVIWGLAFKKLKLLTKI